MKRDIWNFGAGAGGLDYTYPADNTAPIDTISSSDASDNQPILVSGLDIFGFDITQIAILTGQTKALLPIPLWRIYRILNVETSIVADRSIGFAGSIYVYEDTAIVTGVPTDLTKVRAFVFDGDNQTQMTHYTVPKGWMAFAYGSSIKLSKKTSASVDVEVWTRTIGSVFRLSDTITLNSLGTGSFASADFLPGMIPELTDIVFAADADSNNVGIAAAYYILLLDKDVWGI